jgi:hypothetical protein
VSIPNLLARGQRAWLATATDTCRITRAAVTGDAEFVAQVLDPDTLQYPEQGRVELYEGPCRVQVKVDINSNVVETTAGDREWTYLVAQLQLPVFTPEGATGDVADVDVDHICEVLTSPSDPTLVDVVYNIQGIYHKSHAVYRRFRVREVIA